jgi:type IV/VI secretion system ImpK/VasF family protein
MMDLKVWHDLVASNREAAELISAITPEAAASDVDDMRPLMGGDAMENLHGQLRQTLARVAARLGESLPKDDIKQLLFILAIAVDEKVQRRMAPEEASKWPLLQRALFDVHDGGDMFYDLIDDRFERHDTSPLIFEFCFFCLSDGFVGRHSRNKPMIEEYKRKLASRIALPHQGNESEDRTTAYMPPVAANRLPGRYYLWTAGAAVLVPLLLLLFW